MYYVFEFLKFGGHEEFYLIVLAAVFALIFIFEKNPKPDKEEVYDGENYEEEEHEEEVEEKEERK
jgi:hypothetical protein